MQAHIADCAHTQQEQLYNGKKESCIDADGKFNTQDNMFSHTQITRTTTHNIYSIKKPPNNQHLFPLLNSKLPKYSSYVYIDRRKEFHFLYILRTPQIQVNGDEHFAL